MEKIFSLKKVLLNLTHWFNTNQRSLSFRKNPTPYTTWISEVMSQQTTINGMLPYFEKFIHQYPNIYILSQANIQDILTQWSGLGYYSRAYNLHKTAQIIVHQYNGTFPTTLKELKTLPGIGDYTAGAILSLAMEQPSAMVDTNITRVLSRFYIKNTTYKEYYILAQHWVDFAHSELKISSSIINQALMEVGALICKAKTTNCNLCPLSSDCSLNNNQQKNLLEYPTAKYKPPKKEIKETMALITYQKENQHYFLLETKEQKWTKGLWDLPKIIENTALLNYQNNLHYSVQYTITHHKITRDIYIFSTHNIPSFIQIDKPQWVCITNLSLNQIAFPVSSALKKSMMTYIKKYINHEKY